MENVAAQIDRLEWRTVGFYKEKTGDEHSLHCRLCECTLGIGRVSAF